MYSNQVLDTIEAFLETHPDLEEKLDIQFDERLTGENETVRMMHVTIGGVKHLVQAKQVGV